MEGNEVNVILIGIAALTPFGILLWRVFVVAAATKTNAAAIEALKEAVAAAAKHDGEKFKDLFDRTSDHKATLTQLAETVKTLQDITLPRIEKSLYDMDAKIERKFDSLMDKIEMWRAGK